MVPFWKLLLGADGPEQVELLQFASTETNPENVPPAFVRAEAGKIEIPGVPVRLLALSSVRERNPPALGLTPLQGAPQRKLYVVPLNRIDPALVTRLIAEYTFAVAS
jgi:hypothetical protein